MRRTFTTTMPDRVGAFLGASRCIAQEGANITRVSYHKAIDMHMLFLEAEGSAQQLDRIQEGLKGLGYLPEKPQQGAVMMLEFKLRDQPGTVLPVLEVIDRFHFNISYINSQENGGPYQFFKMGLFVEDSGAVSRFMREVSQLCDVRVLACDPSEKNLDNTVFYLNFAGEVASKAGLSDGDSRQLMLSANRIMQLLDQRDKPPYKTFEYIGRFAEQIHENRVQAYEARLSRFQAAGGVTVLLAEPPTGCNVTVLEKEGQRLYVDSGFACYREETLAVLRTLVKDFDASEATALVTHADVDHCGLLDLYAHAWMSRRCYQNFCWEQEGRPNLRERNPVHEPYVRISKLLSGYQPPRLDGLCVVGGGEEEAAAPLTPIGELRQGGFCFQVYEGWGGHVAGETLWIERQARIVLTGDVLVNLKGFTAPQAAFNRLAPFLMTSVDTDPARAAAERKALYGLLEPGEWLLLGGHGQPLRYTVPKRA